MTLATMIAKAKADGVAVFLTPAGTVRLRGAQPAIAKWTPILRLHKPEIIALLKADSEPVAVWDAADWQAYYHERAGVAEYDGALPRAQAETQAFRCCVSEWMCRHPVTSELGQCAWCGRGDLAGRGLLPYGDADHGHTWLHGECWPAWYAQRRQAAVVALAGFGIKEVMVGPFNDA